jgi:S-(hydroxymethyl)glutathione dehydrogenase/alcohol dehydrogenase
MVEARGALLFDTTEHERNQWQVTDLVVDSPKEGEILIKMRAAGMCHSDVHAAAGDQPSVMHPWLSGHEGAGIVEEVGPGVTGFAPGDHVTCTFIPSCGNCPPCVRGLGQLCDRGASLLSGIPLEGTSRIHTADGQPVGQMVFTGTFSEYTVAPVDSVIKIDEDIPFEAAAITGCCVPTGWGTAVNIAGVEVDDTVVVIGAGGVGMNGVQGAKYAGAKDIVVVDTAPLKLTEAPKFGATHTVGSIDEAFPLVQELTRGVMADKVILTVGVISGEHVQPAMNLVRKAGILAIGGVSAAWQTDIKLGLLYFVLQQQTIKGGLYGGCQPKVDIPRLLARYQRGDLMLDELVTRTYRLDDVNQAWEDMEAGRNIRGVIVFPD